MDNHTELMVPEDAGKYLGATPQTTLQWWRTMGRGPRYVKIGRKVYYKRADLDAFIQAGEREPEAA